VRKYREWWGQTDIPVASRPHCITRYRAMDAMRCDALASFLPSCLREGIRIDAFARQKEGWRPTRSFDERRWGKHDLMRTIKTDPSVHVTSTSLLTFLIYCK
jgi:hypothetical protein